MNSQPPSAAVWAQLSREAQDALKHDVLLSAIIQSRVLRAGTLGGAVGRVLAESLAHRYLPEDTLESLYADFRDASGGKLDDIIAHDLATVLEHDPAARGYLMPVLFFKGFHALQAYRLTHHLWHERREHMACFLQSRVSALLGVDIHPAAKIGRGVMMDHATGIVIGETAVVEDGVLFWHGVTLGGRGPKAVDRHPKVRKGAVLGAQSTILGNIEIGAGAKIGACSVVLHNVPAGATVTGAFAKEK